MSSHTLFWKVQLQLFSACCSRHIDLWLKTLQLWPSPVKSLFFSPPNKPRFLCILLIATNISHWCILCLLMHITCNYCNVSDCAVFSCYKGQVCAYLCSSCKNQFCKMHFFFNFHLFSVNTGINKHYYCCSRMLSLYNRVQFLWVTRKSNVSCFLLNERAGQAIKVILGYKYTPHKYTW